MSSEQQMFRKTALEKLASPERLDVAMQVTSPAGWLALLALGLLIALAIVWSVIGKISTRVEGDGILIRGGSVLAVASDSEGRLTGLEVSPGQVIHTGQVVGVVAQAELLSRIDNQEAVLEGLERQAAAAAPGAMEKYLQDKIRAQEGLVARGLITKSALMGTTEELANINRQKVARSNEIDLARRTLRELQAILASATKITSPYEGRVLEVLTDRGELVHPGMRLFTLEDLRSPIRVMLYVAAGEGKKIRPGMEARISPSTVKAEEYGFMIGRVRKISEFPVSPDGLRRVLRNDKLVAQLSGAAAPLEVTVELTRDPRTPSGFKWSSREGPPVGVFTGTLCSGAIVVEQKRPISYVLPILKSGVGM